jgi:hypothetical protein
MALSPKRAALSTLKYISRTLKIFSKSLDHIRYYIRAVSFKEKLRVKNFLRLTLVAFLSLFASLPVFPSFIAERDIT